jgi:hypothetical protein
MTPAAAEEAVRSIYSASVLGAGLMGGSEQPRADKTEYSPNSETKVVQTPEIKAPNTVKSSDVTGIWDDFLGPNQTNYNPQTGQIDPNRIFSADGTRSIRFGAHEMNSMNTSKFHFHFETWIYDETTNNVFVTNILQRII